MIVIDFQEDKHPDTDTGTDEGYYQRLGRRVTLYQKHPNVRNASRQKLIAIAKEISGESGPFNFCYGHPMCTLKRK